MTQSLPPRLGLLVLTAGLPLLSETIYSPALPDIAYALSTSDNMAEYTLTIYLFAFALGTLFWGSLSDYYGRKPCLMAGLVIYTLGCLGCFMATSITFLLISRFIQAFGGSTGSVLTQAICRDTFKGSERGKAFAYIGSSLALAPAVGPVIGGMVDQHFGWSAIFLLLIVMGCTVLYCVHNLLEESYPPSIQRVKLVSLGLSLLRDPHVMGSSILVAAVNGISFSFYAEGSFYFIGLLGLSPAQYGFCFVGIASAAFTGALLSRYLHNRQTSMTIIKWGINAIIIGCSLFLSTVLATMANTPLISISLMSMMIITLGIGMVGPSVLAQALINYQYAVGTASSLFGCFYYLLISLLTLGIGTLHNDSLWLMPAYFLGISLVMKLTFRYVLFQKPVLAQT